MRAELVGVRITGPDPVESASVPVRTGSVTALYGLNGAGKSRVLAGLDATVRGIRPPRGEESDGSLVLVLADADDEQADTTYSAPLARRARSELRSLWQLTAQHRGGEESPPDRLEELLAGLVRMALVDGADAGGLPAEVDRLAEQAAAGRTVAVRSLELPDDRVDPGEPRPIRIVPAVPPSIHDLLDAIDPSATGIDATAVEALRRRLETTTSDVPVPLYVPVVPEPVVLTAAELRLLPPIVRLEDEDFSTPTLAVLYGVPTLRDELDVAHRPLLDMAIDDSFELAREVAESAERLQAEANNAYQRVLQDAPPLRLRVRHPNEWARLPAMRWEAEVSAAPPDPAQLPPPGDEHLPGRWLPIRALSTGQRRWASFAIRLACLLADPADGPYGAVVILDEPEQALHRQAERYCAEGLRQLADELRLVVIAATHSPEVLDARDVIPLHVTRDSVATTKVRGFPGWLTADEDTLGLARSDLVLRYRTFLLVEGAHDEAALRVWAGEDLEAARTRILRLGGARGLAPVITSQLLFDMTDAHVVVLLDGVDGPRFRSAWEEAVAGWHGGQPAAARARLDELAAAGGEMERLASFCRDALERGHDERVHPFGLREADISRYIPVQIFAPDRPETWEELYREAKKAHGRRMSGRTYKDWLAGRGINISVASLEAAAAEVERPPEIDELVDLCRRTSRFRVSAQQNGLHAPLDDAT